MNQLAHIFITYFILSFIIPETQKYLFPIALSAIILDLDHVPGYIKMLSISKTERSRMQLGDYISMFRTAIQEPIGIITIESIFLILYLYGIQNIYLLIASLGIAIHWLIDFLTVHTRPFDPIDKRIVSLFFRSKKQRLVSEITITAVSAILFLIIYF